MNTVSPLDAPLPGRTQENWPNVIGWISVGFGALGVVGSICSQVFTALGQSPQMQVLQPSPLVRGLSFGAGMLSTILLITAGVALLLRHPLARRLYMVWSPFALVLWLIGAMMMAATLPELGAQARTDPTSPFAGAGRNPGVLAVTAGIASCALLPGLLLPGFCLVWFGLLGKGRDLAPRP
jgi:hypothetical protein